MFLQRLVSKPQQSLGLGLLSVGIIDMYYYVPHMGVWDQTWVLVCAASTSPTDPLPSFSLVFLDQKYFIQGFTHFPVNDMLVFSMVRQYSTVNIYHIFFNSSSAGGWWAHRLTP